MFPILLLVLLVALVVYCFREAQDSDRAGEVFEIVGSSLFFATLVLVGVWITTYTKSISTVAKMDAFYKATKSAYEYSVTATKEIEIKALKDMKENKPSPPSMQMFDSGEFAYFKLALVASEQIREFRNKIEWYNSTLESYNRWNKFWFTKGFLVDAPSYLKPIILKQ